MVRDGGCGRVLLLLEEMMEGRGVYGLVVRDGGCGEVGGGASGLCGRVLRTPEEVLEGKGDDAGR